MPASEVFRAERSAAQLLEKFWRSSGAELPVDPIALAEDLGIRVQQVPLRADESGNIVLTRDSTPVISLNGADSRNRQRFTCAHEIGHYINRAGQDQESFVDFRDTLAGLGHDPREIFANQFAAALLMPADEVRRRKDSGISTEEMARTFVTSPQAMTLRLKNLRLA